MRPDIMGTYWGSTLSLCIVKVTRDALACEFTDTLITNPTGAIMATSDRKKGKLNRRRPEPLLYAMTDPIAERLREVEGSSLRSIGHIASLQRITDNDADEFDPPVMSAGRREDNQNPTLAMRIAIFPAQV
jgi:hypothetical protein